MIDSLEIVKRRAIIEDSGPIYNEFIHDATVHEPWNAYSSLFFFIPIIFWIWRLKGEYREHLIIVAILPLLFMNALGSTLYHAFRNSGFFLILDWLPASMMSITLATFFWTKFVKKWYWGLSCVIAMYTLAGFIIDTLSEIPSVRPFAPNIGYFFVGCSLFLPLTLYLFRIRFKFWIYAFATAIFLTLALLCRSLDYPTPNPFPKLLPQGTHFLWHIFSSFAVFSLGYFVYQSNKLEKKLAGIYGK